VTIQTTADFLEQEVNSRIDKLKVKTEANKTKVGIINALSISLGALITLTLGLVVAPDYASLQKNIALLMGALLTIVNGWGALFDYKKLWVRQKSTLLELYQLQNELGYRKSKHNEPSVDDLFEKYQHVWKKDSYEWRSIIQPTFKETLEPANESEYKNKKREVK